MTTPHEAELRRLHDLYQRFCRTEAKDAVAAIAWALAEIERLTAALHLAANHADDGEIATEVWISNAIEWLWRDGRRDALLAVVRHGSIRKGTFRRLAADLGVEPANAAAS